MRADIYEVTFGAHVNVPLASRIVPYAGGGAGAMWGRITANETTPGSSANNMSDTSNADWVGFFAAGARVFVTRRFGVRPEFRAVYMPDSHYYRFNIGVFGRF